MNRPLLRWTLLLLLAAATAPRLAADYSVPVTFTTLTGTTNGQSVFVLGSIPQLGNWTATAAVKMVPTNCIGSNCTWTATIGIPEGVTYEYKFVKRLDCAACIGDSGNISYEPGANRTNTTPAGPPAPFAGKTVFYYSGWTNISLIYSNWTVGWTSKIMTAVGPGRSVGEKLWRADGINVPGQPNLMFVFSDNAGRFDNPDGVNGRNYETPLDAFVVQDGQVFNYWPAPTIATPSVVTFFMTPTNGLQGRTVRVYLPRGFTNNVSKRYPVIYMNDGQNLFLGQGNFGGWNADTNATHLARYGRMREAIIVGMDNTSDRTCEYNPCNLGSCGASNTLAPRYADFVINQLKPYIDTQFTATTGRTLPDAANTGIIGSSRGGLCAMWLAWERPEVFGKIGGLSPSFWGCDTTKNNLALPPKRPLRIYLDSGTVGDFPSTDPVCNPCYDGQPGTITARDNLLKVGYALNVDLDHWVSPGDQHNEFFWNRRLPRCFTFLFPTTDEPNVVLETAAPLRITEFRRTNNVSAVTWPALQARRYSVQGSTNLGSAGGGWSDVFNTTTEVRPWNYPVATVTNAFQFFRVRRHAGTNGVD